MLIRVLRMKLIKVLAAGWLSSSSECSPSNTLCFLSLFFLPSENCKKKSSAAPSLSLTPSKLLAHLPRASFVLLCRCWTVNQTGECISLCSQCNFGERTFRVSLEKKEKSKFTSMASTVVLYCALKLICFNSSNKTWFPPSRTQGAYHWLVFLCCVIDSLFSPVLVQNIDLISHNTGRSSVLTLFCLHRAHNSSKWITWISVISEN